MFGCLSYASTICARRSKFDPRAVACIFLGYPPGMKGYKLYNIAIGQIFISRDVVFHEKSFPFQPITDVYKHNVDEIFGDFVLPHPLMDIPGSYPSSSIQNSTNDIAPPVNLDDFTNDIVVNEHNIAAEHVISDTEQCVNHHCDNTVNLEISVPLSTTDTSVSTQQHHDASIQRSTRQHHAPGFLKDYHCNLHINKSYLPHKTLYPIDSYLSYDQLNLSHQHFFFNVSTAYEPSFFHQVAKNPSWRHAMDEEIAAMERTNTWSIVPLPSGHHAVGCKWIYKIKHKNDGTIDRYNARLVAKGYSQQEGIDFNIFFHVAKIVSVKVLLNSCCIF